MRILYIATIAWNRKRDWKCPIRYAVCANLAWTLLQPPNFFVVGRGEGSCTFSIDAVIVCFTLPLFVKP